MNDPMNLLYGTIFTQPLSPSDWRNFVAQQSANIHRTPQQSKLDAAKAFLKERAELHPEWTVRRG